jgi:methionine-R-sulfoxide reductase
MSFAPCVGLGCSVDFFLIYDVKTKTKNFFGTFRTDRELELFNYGNDEKIDFVATLSKEKQTVNKKIMDTSYKKTDDEWKKILTPEQYYVLRQKGTERAGTGEYNNHTEKGFYTCAGCGTELFSNEQKFDSHCGWPSFDKEIEGGKIIQTEDLSHGMKRSCELNAVSS